MMARPMWAMTVTPRMNVLITQVMFQLHLLLLTTVMSDDDGDDGGDDDDDGHCDHDNAQHERSFYWLAAKRIPLI